MNRRSLALFVVLLAAATDLTDGAVVNILLPVMRHDLGAGDNTPRANAGVHWSCSPWWRAPRPGRLRRGAIAARPPFGPSPPRHAGAGTG